ncbi:MAG: glycerol acyltransferase [Salinivirgaceae bacterium]|jgi:putative hemolysin|nr:glycerol acyltransferase [Salinivirgaceae bacterium]
MSTSIQPIQIDIRKAMALKSPGLARSIPGFVYRFIERTIHQDDINRILRKYADKTGVEFVRSLLKEFNVTYTVHNEHLIPKDGRYIFASNHPLGGFDGVVMADVLASHWGEPRLLVNDLLLLIENYNPLFLPINKHGSHSREAIQKIDEAFKADYPILDFPFGLVSRKHKGEIKDLVWRRTFVNRARKYERDIVPVFFDGQNSKKFYRVAQWRKKLGLKVNLEMFYLPGESFKQYNSHFNIYFGEPIPYQSLTRDKCPDQWAEEIKSIAYSLKP